MRTIITIDESLCDGCGQCVTACAEGAIELRDGKARLVGESYCDGLGACLGECPRGAIRTEVREAAPFDAAATAAHLSSLGRDPAPALAHLSGHSIPPVPGLKHWPVKLRLVPEDAPWLDGADLLVAADCAAFAAPDLHTRILPGKVVVAGCPKFDDLRAYREKLTAIFRRRDIRSVEVAYMEVPCCSGLARAVAGALEDAGRKIPVTLTRLGVEGERR